MMQNASSSKSLTYLLISSALILALSCYAFCLYLVSPWTHYVLSTVPLTNGIMANIFSTTFLTTLTGIVFFQTSVIN